MQTKQIINPVDRFLSRYPYKTKATYKGALRGYFNFLGANPETYFIDNRDYNADILFYAQNIRDKYAPKTYHCYLSCIRKFLERNRVMLDINTKEDLNFFQKIKQPITRDRIATQEELKNILSFANLEDKAIFLTLLSSGMRVGECVQFTIDDIFIKEKPVRIELDANYCKNKTSRTVFISNEAKRYMTNWLERRETYLQGIAQKGVCVRYHKPLNDDRVFPITTSAVRIRWNNLLDKTKLGKRDKRTGVREIHLHTLRKYFSTRMGDSCNRDILELLLGHNGYLSNSYLRVTKQELGDAYKKAMSKVTIYESKDKSHAELEQEIKRRDKQIEEIGQRTEFLKNLDKTELAKLIAVLKGKPLEEVWKELGKRPTKFVKNIPEEAEK